MIRDTGSEGSAIIAPVSTARIMNDRDSSMMVSNEALTNKTTHPRTHLITLMCFALDISEFLNQDLHLHQALGRAHLEYDLVDREGG